MQSVGADLAIHSNCREAELTIVKSGSGWQQFSASQIWMAGSASIPAPYSAVFFDPCLCLFWRNEIRIRPIYQLATKVPRPPYKQLSGLDLSEPLLPWLPGESLFSLASRFHTVAGHTNSGKPALGCCRFHRHRPKRYRLLQILADWDWTKIAQRTLESVCFWPRTSHWLA